MSCDRMENDGMRYIDGEMTPVQAAEKIVKVINDPNPALHNQVDFNSTFFLVLNRFLPKFMKDFILINYMKIKE